MGWLEPVFAGKRIQKFNSHSGKGEDLNWQSHIACPGKMTVVTNLGNGVTLSEQSKIHPSPCARSVPENPLIDYHQSKTVSFSVDNAVPGPQLRMCCPVTPLRTWKRCSQGKNVLMRSRAGIV
jgi:hypothetical protein